jgi:hypothetical protein
VPAHRRQNLNLPVAATFPRPSDPPASPAGAAATPPPPRLVLVALGAPADPAGPALLPPAVASRLEGLTGLPMRPIPDPADPDAALAALAASPGAWLAPLTLDPGLALPRGSWAEALGAWRQPVLLLVGSAQPPTGLPAAATALLLQRGVPLVGLIQWGGTWDGEARRRDGLPWLGWLDPQATAAPGPASDDGEAALLAALELRWRRIQELLA